MDGHALQADVERYVELGVHRTASPGDLATADWLREGLDHSGFETRFIEGRVPYFEPRTTEIAWEASAPLGLFPAWPIVTTPAPGIEARGVLVTDPTGPLPDVAGCIAVVDLPFPTYGTLNQGPARDQLDTIIAGQPAGVVLLTQGLTGEIIALNSNVSRTPFPCPVAYGAPREASGLRDAARAGARLTLRVQADLEPQAVMRSVAGERPGDGPAIVVSTPISGWFHCGGERGPGIAFWRALASRLPERLPGRRLVFIANSGHEIDGVGARDALRRAVPKPGEVAVWAHLGAGMATYQWRSSDAGLRQAEDLGPDAARYLVTGTKAFLPTLATAFAGQPGLERPQHVRPEEAHGETRVFLAEGYENLFGVFASHDLHHTPIDMADSTGPELLAPVADGLERAILALATA